MGTDKAFIEVGGQWLIARALAALAEAAQRLVVGGTDPRLKEAAAAADAWHIADRWPGEGPLGAVVTALGRARHPVTVILPCDLPAVSPADVAALVQAVPHGPAGAGPSAAIFTDQRRRHYLPLAIDSGAASLARGLFESGRRSVASLLDAVTVIDVAASPTAVADLDSPEDLWLGH